MGYNLNEIFSLAAGIEKSGYNFYRKAADKLPEYRDFFLFLAKEEIKHDAAFENIKKDALPSDAGADVWDPDNIINEYFNSLSDSAIFNKEKQIEELFNKSLSFEDVIEWALKREHDTILFFTGLKSSLDSEEEKKVVDQIISEEINHVHLLMSKKSEVLS